MTDDTMALRGLLEKSSDADLLREMIGFAVHRVMEFEMAGLSPATWSNNTVRLMARTISAAAFGPEAARLSVGVAKRRVP
jgi:hypothetical protein